MIEEFAEGVHSIEQSSGNPNSGRAFVEVEEGTFAGTKRKPLPVEGEKLFQVTQATRRWAELGATRILLRYRGLTLHLRNNRATTIPAPKASNIVRTGF